MKTYFDKHKSAKVKCDICGTMFLYGVEEKKAYGIPKYDKLAICKSCSKAIQKIIKDIPK